MANLPAKQLLCNNTVGFIGHSFRCPETTIKLILFPDFKFSSTHGNAQREEINAKSLHQKDNTESL